MICLIQNSAPHTGKPIIFKTISSAALLHGKGEKGAFMWNFHVKDRRENSTGGGKPTIFIYLCRRLATIIFKLNLYDDVALPNRYTRGKIVIGLRRDENAVFRHV